MKVEAVSNLFCSKTEVLRKGAKPYFDFGKEKVYFCWPMDKPTDTIYYMEMTFKNENRNNRSFEKEIPLPSN